jgi:hypothetical protein
LHNGKLSIFVHPHLLRGQGNRPHIHLIAENIVNQFDIKGNLPNLDVHADPTMLS